MSKRCPVYFEANTPPDLCWLVFTSRILAWGMVREIATRHGLSIEESRVGWFTKRFVFRGEVAGLNGFVEELWDHPNLGYLFRRTVEDIRTKQLRDSAEAHVV